MCDLDPAASVEDLIPPVPILTRYKKEVGIRAFVKKEVIDPRLPDERRGAIEFCLENQSLEGIEAPTEVRSQPCLGVDVVSQGEIPVVLPLMYSEEVSEWVVDQMEDVGKFMERSLDEKSRSFVQKEAFDGSRKDINAAIDRISEFTGTKMIFWDLREPFIDNLYKPSVSHSRLETLIEPLDTVLNLLCDIIVEPLRDRIVTGLLQASLDGFLRVILDGGPSRVFFPNDAKLLEEDLETLKEFFISGGDGLPRGVVENQVARVRHIVKLHECETRVLIDDLKSASGLEMQGNRSRLGADPQALLRILCHRSDSEASQFLKKQYKLPRSSA
ncbi:hypothetical protein HHK36_011764 [Tetracentron sinense]|uniref:MHD2 domain-containing protein n=1 Tax=Tetracentron sinense TaxID=13715 RepID=A0A834ZDG7_TETSI|nr:hypothetical protein HHK36_011764 [Tetracentron sinense]